MWPDQKTIISICLSCSHWIIIQIGTYIHNLHICKTLVDYHTSYDIDRAFDYDIIIKYVYNIVTL